MKKRIERKFYIFALGRLCLKKKWKKKKKKEIPEHEEVRHFVGEEFPETAYLSV